MKKLLVLLLISLLAIFALTGCDGLVPSEGEGEGEGEGEVEGVTVEVADSVNVAGKDWVAAGAHDITVTFPTPVAGTVMVTITDCSGEYPLSKSTDGEEVVMFPDADRKVWTGSGDFGKDGDGECCASYVEVTAGECEADTCIVFPIIVDDTDPYAKILIDVDTCTCEGCSLDFEIDSDSDPCADATPCCGDDCTAITGGAIAIYDEEPFDECCETPCAEPIFTCPITECPELDTEFCPTECLDADADGETYWMIVNLVDAVGNETEYYAKLILTRDGDSDCVLEVEEYYASDSVTPECACTDWTDLKDTDDYVGYCQDTNNCED